MIERLFSRLTKVYQTAFVLLVLVTLGTVFYFWKSGFIDGSRIQNVHKASFVLENYGKETSLKDIQELIHVETPKKAIDKIDRITADLSSVHEILEVEEFEDVQTNAKKLKSEAGKLIRFTRSDKVLMIFGGKIGKFHQFVQKNRWRTLTRMSERILSKVSGHINKEKLGALSKGVLREFESMIKITENSVLSRADKAEIVSRIQNLKTEMIMLSKFSQARDRFDTRFSRFENSVQNWLAKVSPEITMGKIENQELGKTYMLAMLGIVGLVTVLFFMSFLFNRWYFRSAKIKLEQDIENYLSLGILECDASVYADSNEDFKNYSNRMASYIAKRMSFGKIFQESLPFASIMLDKNLKVMWANAQFCDDWQITKEEIKKEYMSWDYLNKLTNIGSDDPIMEALKNNIAGIYQIQMKANDDIEARPYEMFVSPIQVNDETKIMLYFYDLTNLEETIKDQSKSILNPVKKSVDSIIAGDFVANEQMEYEFKIAGIEDVYEKFIALNENIYYSENELIAKLKGQEFEYDKLGQIVDSIYATNDASKAELSTIKVALKNFKTNVIGLSEAAKTLMSSLERSRELICTNIAALKASSTKVRNLRSTTLEMANSLPSFDEMKAEMKASKKTQAELKLKLASEITQLKKVIESKGEQKLVGQMNKLAGAFESLMSQSEELDRKVSGLEIGMSKAHMIVSSGQEKIIQINDEYELSQVQYSQSELSRVEKINMSEMIHSQENEIISSLQDLYFAHQNLQKNILQISEADQAHEDHSQLSRSSNLENNAIM